MEKVLLSWVNCWYVSQLTRQRYTLGEIFPNVLNITSTWAPFFYEVTESAIKLWYYFVLNVNNCFMNKLLYLTVVFNTAAIKPWTFTGHLCSKSSSWCSCYWAGSNSVFSAGLKSFSKPHIILKKKYLDLAGRLSFCLGKSSQHFAIRTCCWSFCLSTLCAVSWFLIQPA